MLKLEIVICSTRPGRVGGAVGKWFEGFAKAHGKFEIHVTDLAELNLPLLDEPEHPRFKKYTKEHTKKWSAIVDGADAFAFVTPEYDFFMPASLLNAIQFLAQEWVGKPCAFVAYGGISGGLRSVQSAKPVITSMKMMPLPEAVSIQMVNKHIANGVFTPEEMHGKSGTAMLDELVRWAGALKPLRAP